MVFYYHSSHVPAVHGTPSYRLPEECGYSQSVCLGVPNLFSREKILNSPELFWVAFCIEASRFMGDGAFSTDLQRDRVFIHGKVDMIPQIEKVVDVIRQLFLAAYQEKTAITILSIEVGSNCFIRERTNVVDLSDWFKDPVELCYNDFVRYIEPCIPGLAWRVGACYSQDVILQKIITGAQTRTIRIEEVGAFAVHWTWDEPQPMFSPLQRMTSMKV